MGRPSRRVGIAAALVLTLGGGLLTSPADAAIGPPAAGSTISGIVTVHESVVPTVYNSTGPGNTLSANGRSATGSPCSAPSFSNPSGNRDRSGQTNLYVYKGTTAASPSLSFGKQTFAPATGTSYPAGGADFNFSTRRWPNGTYNLRTTKQDRLSTTSTPTASATCGLGAETDITTIHNVTLTNLGKIDSIAVDSPTGVGNSGTTTTFKARLVDAGTNAPFVTSGTQGTLRPNFNSSGAACATPATLCFGNIGATFEGFSSAGSIYLTSLGGFDQGVPSGATTARFNYLKAVDPAGWEETFYCNNVRNDDGAFAVDGFNGCFRAAPATPAPHAFTADTKIVDAHDPAKLTFTVAGTDGLHSAQATIDRVTGFASATVDTPFVPVGPNNVNVTSSNDGFLAPVSAVGSATFRGAVTTTYTGAPNAFWNDTYTATASVVDAVVPTVIVNHGQVVFTRGTQVSAPVPVINGVATVTMRATDTPATGDTIKAAYTDPIDNLYNGDTSTKPFLTKPRPTALSYIGDLTGNYNSQATLKAKLVDACSACNDQGDLGDPLPGMSISFKVGDDPADLATTLADGVATKVIDVQSDVGSLPLNVDFLGTARYAADHVLKSFFTDYQYKFTDTLVGNHGSVLLNPDTQQAGVAAPSGDRSRIADNAYQLSLYLPTIVGYPDDPGATLPELPEEWNILNLPRLSDLFGIIGAPPAIGTLPPVSTTPPPVPPVTPPALPELPIAIPMTSSASANAAAASGPGPQAGTIVLPDPIGGSPGSGPNGGMTIGDLINGVAGAGIPTSLSTCELLSGSTCERRFIIAAVLGGGPNVVGVFDVRSGLFASLVRAPTIGFAPLPLLASLGACMSANVPLCIGAPALPSGPPTLPPPPSLNGDGLLGAIQGLIAGLQSIPDQITAPPAPTVPTLPTTPPEVPETPTLPTGSSATPAPSGTLLSGAGNTLASLVPAYWLG